MSYAKGKLKRVSVREREKERDETGRRKIRENQCAFFSGVVSILRYDD